MFEEKQLYLLLSDRLISCFNIVFNFFFFFLIYLIIKIIQNGHDCPVKFSENFIRPDCEALPYSLMEGLSLLIFASFMLSFVNGHGSSGFLQILTSKEMLSDEGLLLLFFTRRSTALSFKQTFPMLLISFS